MSQPESPMPHAWRVHAQDSDFHSPEPGLQRRILVHNENMMLVEHRMEANWKGARHAHPQEQLVYVIAGRLRFTCGEESVEIGPGDSLIVPSNIEHEAAALGQPCTVLDVFTPTRPDYVPRPRDK